MKNAILLFFLLLGYFSFAQVQVQATNFSKQNFSLSLKSFNPANYMISLKSFNSSSKYSFSAYNKNTDLNDNYTFISDTYKYRNSTFEVENLHRSLKIDSFNPNGANDLGSAVITGLINTVFDGTLKFR